MQSVAVVVKSHMQETFVQLRKQYVTPAKNKAIIVPNVSRENLSQMSTSLHTMSNPKSTYYDTLFLDTIDTGQKNMWTATIQVEGKDVCFKLDTGAEVTVVGGKVLHSLDSKKLQTPTKRLYGPDQTCLEVLGEIPVTLVCKNRSCSQQSFIVKNLQQNLLGLPAIKSLSLLTPIEMVSTPTYTRAVPITI